MDGWRMEIMVETQPHTLASFHCERAPLHSATTLMPRGLPPPRYSTLRSLVSSSCAYSPFPKYKYIFERSICYILYLRYIQLFIIISRELCDFVYLFTCTEKNRLIVPTRRIWLKAFWLNQTRISSYHDKTRFFITRTFNRFYYKDLVSIFWLDL